MHFGGRLLYQLSGCVSSKPQFPTAARRQKSFLWMLDCEWKSFQHRNVWVCVADVLAPAGGNSSHNHAHVEQPTGDSHICAHSMYFGATFNMMSPNRRVKLFVFEDNEAVMRKIM